MRFQLSVFVIAAFPQVLPSLDKPAVAVAQSTTAVAGPGELPLGPAMRRLGICVALLCALFCMPLVQLVALALESELYSHIPLIPLISIYMVWISRQRIPKLASPSPVAAAALTGLGLVALAIYGFLLLKATHLPRNDSLALSIGAFVCFLMASAFFCLGWPVIRCVAMPIALLFFLIPFPTVVKNGLETFLQQSSAEASDWLFKLSTVPVHREGVVFALPGITIQVAEECSGIRSSFVLFITGLIGGYIFLENPWHRFWFSLLTIPLGIIRNGFRVVVISMLCVYISPDMIHSPIHHRGGPIFFVLSLIPLFGVLILFRKRERAVAGRVLNNKVTKEQRATERTENEAGKAEGGARSE
jgi:exosortase C (VPDSG-CTERM-specific)